MNVWERPWGVRGREGGGDFNVVQHSSERLRASRHTQAMIDFADFIFEQRLIDLPMVGGRITWSNWRVGSRLDTFLISTYCEEYFPEVCQKRLPRGTIGPFSSDVGVWNRKKGSNTFMV
jgi:hypothetical protein